MYRSFVTVALLVSAWAAGARAGGKTELPLLFQDDFEKGAGAWEPTDPKAWKVIDSGTRGKVYNQFQLSKYKPPHRSPFNVSLVKNVVVGDFVLEALVQST